MSTASRQLDCPEPTCFYVHHPAGHPHVTPAWVREASERLHREHPPPCALTTTVTGKCTCPDPLADERADVLRRFTDELAKATGDGSRKRQAGTKPPWYEDDSHEVALFSHLAKWKRGEIVDPDSGAHTLVHLAWRALAIALRETGNIPSA